MVAGTDGQDTRVNTFQIGHRTGDHQGPPHRILTPLYLSPRQGSPTIRRIGPQSSCIVGAGEDVDVGRGPWWLPVRTHHHIYSPYLKCIDHQGPPLREIPAVLKVDAYWNQFITSGWGNTCGHGPTPVGRDKSGPYAPYTII